MARGGAEDDAEAVLVVAWRGEVHHFDGAAGEAEGHGPEGALAGPVGDLVEGCSVSGKGWLVMGYNKVAAAEKSFARRLDGEKDVLEGWRARKTYNAYCMAPSFFSWLGRGTSRLGLPVAVRGGPWASCDLVTAVAGLADVEEMYAAGPRRERRSEVAGLAVECLSVWWQVHFFNE